MTLKNAIRYFSKCKIELIFTHTALDIFFQEKTQNLFTSKIYDQTAEVKKSQKYEPRNYKNGHHFLKKLPVYPTFSKCDLFFEKSANEKQYLKLKALDHYIILYPLSLFVQF